mmetsp:Transcript_23748/g.35927  ORF Transcript_23748/g.35927 Transcript_23748/m.35927 type:complete len:196 (+) Transcript_23748:108-695(+)|eukprot:CAMPEP_0194201964 /NCGR_PEP_ID=MMETSP0156-20130528/2115_1 /TAXON_ID=33649 /ORGANISM="Thalassionema nitzschioides, Strain L26-B" /LENGTH=195 /DNA_ID=CAMNT_0038927317 /DNA_START=76 /DNA_END=663 /DNA_ORIENTATION=-
MVSKEKNHDGNYYASIGGVEAKHAPPIYSRCGFLGLVVLCLLVSVGVYCPHLKLSFLRGSSGTLVVSPCDTVECKEENNGESRQKSSVHQKLHHDSLLHTPLSSESHADNHHFTPELSVSSSASSSSSSSSASDDGESSSSSSSDDSESSSYDSSSSSSSDDSTSSSSSSSSSEDSGDSSSSSSSSDSFSSSEDE